MITFLLLFTLLLQNVSSICNNINNKQDYENFINKQRNKAAALYTKYEEQSALDAQTCNEIGVEKIVTSIPTKMIMGRNLVRNKLTSHIPDKSSEYAYHKQSYFENNDTTAYRKSLKSAQAGEQAFLNLWTEEEKQNKLFSEKYSIPLWIGGNHASVRNGIFYSKQLMELWPQVGITKNLEEGNYVSFGLMGLGYLLCSFVASKNPEIKKHSKGILLSSTIPFTVGIGYKIYKTRTEENDIITHQSLIDIAHYCNVAEYIYNDKKNDEQFKSAFPQFCNAYEVLSNNATTKSILQDFKTDTFNDCPAVISNVGRLSLVAERLSETKDAFIPLLRAMGELDEYLAIVDFKKQHKTWTYTKPSHDTQRGAWVKTSNYIHPAFPGSIPNSISLGADEPSIAEITGPNACGKSFASKSLLANVLLSEVYGFAFADTFEHAFCNEIRYIANVNDEAGFASRYEAEIAVLVKNYVFSTLLKKENKLCLSVVDEPLNGTKSECGAKATEQYISELQEKELSKHNAHILITHHTLSERPGVAHYCVEDGPDRYKLKKGRASYSNAVSLFVQALEKKKKELFAQESKAKD